MALLVRNRFNECLAASRHVTIKAVFEGEGEQRPLVINVPIGDCRRQKRVATARRKRLVMHS